LGRYGLAGQNADRDQNREDNRQDQECFIDFAHDCFSHCEIHKSAPYPETGRSVFGKRPADAGFRIVKFTLIFLFGNLNTDFIIKITLMDVYKIMCFSESCEYEKGFVGCPMGRLRPLSAD
jgi:hypothetical protein